MKKEAFAQSEVLLNFLDIANKKSRIFRNNVGAAFIKGQWVQFGLCKGSPDLIGWTNIKIKKHMVGRELGVFTAIELKSKKGAASDSQKVFIENARACGCIAGIAKTKAEAHNIITEFETEVLNP